MKIQINKKLKKLPKPSFDIIEDYSALYGDEDPIYIAEPDRFVMPTWQYFYQAQAVINQLCDLGFEKFRELKVYFDKDLKNYDNFVEDYYKIRVQMTIDEIKKNMELIFFRLEYLHSQGVEIEHFNSFIEKQTFACEAGGLENLQMILRHIASDTFEENLYNAKYELISNIASSSLNGNEQEEMIVHIHKGMLLSVQDKYNLELTSDIFANKDHLLNKPFMQKLFEIMKSENAIDYLVDILVNKIVSKFPFDFEGLDEERINKLDIIVEALDNIPIISQEYLINDILEYDEDSLPLKFKDGYLEIMKSALLFVLEEEGYISGKIIHSEDRSLIFTENSLYLYKYNQFEKVNINSNEDIQNLGIFLKEKDYEIGNRIIDQLAKEIIFKIEYLQHKQITTEDIEFLNSELEKIPRFEAPPIYNYIIETDEYGEETLNKNSYREIIKFSLEISFKKEFGYDFNIKTNENDYMKITDNHIYVFNDNFFQTISLEDPESLNFLSRFIKGDFSSENAATNALVENLVEQLPKYMSPDTVYQLNAKIGGLGWISEKAILSYSKFKTIRGYKENYDEIIKAHLSMHLYKEGIFRALVVPNDDKYLIVKEGALFIFDNQMTKINLKKNGHIVQVIEILSKSNARSDEVLKAVLKYKEEEITLLDIVLKYSGDDVINEVFNMISKVDDQNEILNLLLGNENSFDMIDPNINEVLKIALSKGKNGFAETLIESGADITLTGDDQKSLFEKYDKLFSRNKLKKICNNALDNKDIALLINIFTYKEYLEKLKFFDYGKWKLNGGLKEVIKFFKENEKLLYQQNGLGISLYDLLKQNDDKRLLNKFIPNIVSEDVKENVMDVSQQVSDYSDDVVESPQKRIRGGEVSIYAIFDNIYDNPILINNVFRKYQARKEITLSDSVNFQVKDFEFSKEFFDFIPIAQAHQIGGGDKSTDAIVCYAEENTKIPKNIYVIDLYSYSLSFKKVDVAVDFLRLISEPTKANTHQFIENSIYLYGMINGVNGFGFAVTVADVIVKISNGEYYKALETGASSAFFVMAASAVEYASFSGLVYGLAMAAYSGYGAAINAYSLYAEVRTEGFYDRAALAYQNLYYELSIYLQNYLDFEDQSQGPIEDIDLLGRGESDDGVD